MRLIARAENLVPIQKPDSEQAGDARQFRFMSRTTPAQGQSSDVFHKHKVF
jgi:hypothetical protein